MWHFVSPQIVFGEGALDALTELAGRRALVVTDGALVRLGLLERVVLNLNRAGLESRVFEGVEAEPTVEVVCRGAQLATEWQPDWIIGLGGGSPMDAAKAIWVLYERPELEPAAINPFIQLDLRRKARLITIPTTSGTGAEVTWAIVLTDPAERRKMGLGNRENIADMAIVDPIMAAGMPPRLTADTGLDALTHGVEGYTCTWHSDLSDGLCVQAVRNTLGFLPRAVADGADMAAREGMANAATCAGLGFGNAMASLAHAMGHALGAVFGVPHGRAVALFLPYTIEYAAREAPNRFADLARLVGCSQVGGEQGARALVDCIRALAQQIGNPLTLPELGIQRNAYEAQLDKLVDDAFNDTQIVTAPRCPGYEEMRRLFVCAFEGRSADF